MAACMRIELSRRNKVCSFASIGCCDPSKEKSHKQALKSMNELMLEDEVYEDMNIGKRPPKCIFIPDKKMVRIMIKAVLNFKDRESHEAFIMKFGLMEKKHELKLEKVKFTISKLKSLVARKQLERQTNLN